MQQEETKSSVFIAYLEFYNQQAESQPCKKISLPCGHEKMATFLSLVTAPTRVAVSGAGSHHALSTLALSILFPDTQVKAALAHQSWRCLALAYIFSSTTALPNQ